MATCPSKYLDETHKQWGKGAEWFDERIVISVTGCFAGYGIFDALGKAKELGFQSVAVFPDGQPKHSLGELPTLGFYNADDAWRKRIKEKLSSFKRSSIHQAWDSEWKKWIDCAEYFGSEIVTIHQPLRKNDESLERYLENQVHFYCQVADYAQSRGVRIGMENTYGAYEDYVRLVKAIDHPSVGATIDVGHCAYFEEVKSIGDIDKRVSILNDTICQLVNDLASKVYHLHVHNVQRSERMDFSRFPDRRSPPGSLIDHRCINEGEIDFQRMLSVLKEIGYYGMFELELEEPDKEQKAIASALYLSRLLRLDE